ncbi:YhjD/YihY/BrkB family envelope integrity protein [Kitasatospora mediocidica]|uniref:YhjD/YihY/BrkB family envelope integrity protein n=1 Tax=Kitasatospora mediocidica TaxID=58352 RepID=UPI000A032A92|nr:YhjD/YihY/BrkB family envelope integrity protein [Kitasatospora mediocidica]
MGRWSRIRRRADSLSSTARELPTQVPLVGRAVGQLVRVNLLDNATRLAAQAFLSALPALFVVAVFAPTVLRNRLLDSLRDQLGLRGVAQQQVQMLVSLSHSSEEAQTFGALGALVTLLSATTLSRAMQRVCERCWELPRASTRLAAWRWLAWLLVWLIYLVMLGPIRNGFGAGWWLGLPLSFVTATLLWWWTQHLLLSARIRWYPLLPGAGLCGVAVVGLEIASQVYLPSAMSRSVAQFGPYGAVFTCLSWLIVVFSTATLALALGRVIAEDETVARYLGPPLADPRKRRRRLRSGGAAGT